MRGVAAALAAALVCVAFVHGGHGAGVPVAAPPSTQQGPTPLQLAWLMAVGRGTAPASPWPEVSQAQAQALEAKAYAMYSAYKTCCDPWGQTVNMVWTPGSNRSVPYEFQDTGDSAAWTGHVLAAHAMRWNVTQSADALSRVTETLDVFDFLTRCSGKVGFLVRFAGPSDSEPYRRYIGTGSHAYPCVAPWQNQTWLGSLSKDMYFGMALGFATAKVFVQHPSVQAQVSDLAQRVVTRLAEDSFFISSPKPHIPILPNPMLIAEFMRLGLAVNATKYESWSRGPYHEWLALAQATDMTLSSKWSEPYFPNHLSIESQFALLALEAASGGNETQSILNSMCSFVTNGTDHLTADYYAALLAALKLTGLECTAGTPQLAGRAPISGSVATGLLQGLLLDFPPPPIMEVAVNLTSDPAYLPHYDSTHSQFALVPSVRVADSYMWQRSPTQLAGGKNGTKEMQTEAFTLPYWLGRYAGAVPAP